MVLKSTCKFFYILPIKRWSLCLHLLNLGETFVTALVSILLQKLYSVTSKAVKKATWLLLVSLEIIILEPFSHRERSPGTLISPYVGTIWSRGRCYSSSNCWNFSSPGARHANECSYSQQFDCNHVRDPRELI